MKGKYIKPTMAFESTMMTGGLLRDCSDEFKDKFNEDGYWELPNGMNIFLLGSACQLDGEDMGYGCYNNPGEGQYIFRS